MQFYWFISNESFMMSFFKKSFISIGGKLMEGYVMHQVNISDQLHQAAVAYSYDHDTALYHVHNLALNWFIDIQKDPGQDYLPYLASISSLKKRSMWISKETLKRAKELAALDGVPVTRIVYAALFYFFEAVNQKTLAF